jgi:putative transcription factor
MEQDWKPVIFKKQEEKKVHTLHKNVKINKIEQETEDFRHEKITRDLSLAIQKARNDKGWTRKEFAAKINEKEAVIADYETGKAIPSGIIINKMNKVLGVSLKKM